MGLVSAFAGDPTELQLDRYFLTWLVVYLLCLSTATQGRDSPPVSCHTKKERRPGGSSSSHVQGCRLPFVSISAKIVTMCKPMQEACTRQTRLTHFSAVERSLNSLSLSFSIALKFFPQQLLFSPPGTPIICVRFCTVII